MNGFALPAESLLAWLHLLLGAAWFAAAVALFFHGRRTDGPAEVVQRVAAALLAGTAPLYLSAAGWWIDMPNRILVPGFAVLAVIALAGPHRLPGRMAHLAFAGFYLTLGTIALRNAVPIAPVMATKSLLLGAAVLLAVLPAKAAPRLRHATTATLLLAAGAIGFLKEIPFP